MLKSVLKWYGIVCAVLALGFTVQALFITSQSDMYSAVTIAATAWAFSISLLSLSEAQKYKRNPRATYFVISSIAIWAIVIPIVVMMTHASHEYKRQVYRSTPLTLTGDLVGSHYPNPDSWLLYKWTVDPAATLKNDEGWGTAVSVYVDYAWAMRNMVITVDMADGRVIHCRVPERYSVSGDIRDAHCDAVILGTQMGDVKSATVYVDETVDPSQVTGPPAKTSRSQRG